MSEDTPTTAALLIGYKRIDFIQNRLVELSRNVNIPLIVSIDGSDKSTQNLMTTIVKEFLIEHPWMNISLISRDRNLGLANHVTLAISEVLNEYDQVIVIEDDIVVSCSFIENMLNGLSIMKAHDNIGAVAGFSGFTSTKINPITDKWRTSKYFPAWGWATNRDLWKEYELQIPDNFAVVLAQSRTWRSLGRYRKKMWCYRFMKVANNSPHTWDYQMQYLLFRRELKTLLTTNRISDNEGFESMHSSNTKGKRPRWMGEPSVFGGILEMRISKASRVYEIGDAFTIAGDKRLAEDIASLRKFLKCLGGN